MHQEEIKSAGTPFDELIKAGRGALITAFPDLKKTILSREGEKVVDIFVSDCLAARNIPGTSFHRFAPARQQELLGTLQPNEIFENLSSDLINFYQKKLKEAGL